MSRVEQRSRFRVVVWSAFVAASLLFLLIDDLVLWASVVVPAALGLSLVPALRARVDHDRADRRDLVAVGLLYVIVVGLFRLAFTVFTTDNVLGLFLAFGFGLLAGVVGPVVYQVWYRGRDLRSIGLGLRQIRPTLALGLVFAGVQYITTLWGYDFPDPVAWVPLLVMSLVVGLFEAVFFRGFVQGRLEASFGVVPAVAGAALLYSLYHVGYGMGYEEMWFLFGLGVVYAIAYRLTTNVLIIWPLLTPMGAFFNNLQSGDIELPWESILGFAEVGILMAVAIWLAHRHIRKRPPAAIEQPLTQGVEARL